MTTEEPSEAAHQEEFPGAFSAPPVAQPTAPKARTWTRWALPTGAALVGLASGLGIGVSAASSDPTHSPEYRSLQQHLGSARASLSSAEGDVLVAKGAAMSAQAAAAQSQSDLSRQAASIASQAAALTSAQQSVAANSIGEGTWTVGADISPGTYRTSDVVSGSCYWSITKSGTNGDAIIQNDIVTGGRPTVKLSQGQDFTTQRCGTWVKQ
jgi:hypothetical protein